jgi:hypothetical protein
MKVIWSGVAIVVGTGKIGGSVLQNGRFGSIARKWVKGTVVNAPNFNTNSQKQFFREITSNWRALTSVQRLAWNPGVPTGLSGFNLYTKANLSYYRQNGSYLLTPPIQGAAPVITGYTFSVDHSSGDYTISFTVASGASTWVTNIYAANNYSLGVFRPRKSEYRLVQQRFIGPGANSFSSSALVKGVPIIAGAQCFIKIVLFDSLTGLLSAPLFFAAVAT